MLLMGNIQVFEQIVLTNFEIKGLITDSSLTMIAVRTLRTGNQRWETVRGHQKPIEAKSGINSAEKMSLLLLFFVVYWTSKQVFPNLCYCATTHNINITFKAIS